MLVLITISFFLALLISGVIVIRNRSAVDQYGTDMPQRFHLGHVPRLGSLAIVGATTLGWLMGYFLQLLQYPIHVPFRLSSMGMLLLIALPAIAAGLLDDLTQKVGPRWRLIASSASGLLACTIGGLMLPRIGIPSLDSTQLLWPWLGILIAFAGIAGLPHAFNIIDGYNGLAGTVAMMICAALAYVALQVGDREIAGLLVCVIGATLGFLMWNYPRGLIFAGDGGAYFWGVIIATASVTLVHRHGGISPWCILLILIYPISETFFSIYRRYIRGQSPGMADSMHFHQLVYKRVVRGVFHDDKTRRMLMRNNRTSPYLWAFTALSVGPAVLFWYSTPILLFFCGLFVVSYIGAYFMIVRFKVPRWLKM
jgi:UDP-GlcNAc:undecaprenyl-phosphate/decaprenyl-phosphate GlcNAc-1-phosphate transferase